MKRKTALKVDALIDRFVDTINRLPREPGDDDEIPPSVRGRANEWGDFDWQIKPWSGIDWIEPVEEKLGRILPPSYRSLVTRYAFPAFEAGPVQLSGNTPEGVYFEFRERLFADPKFVEILLPAGYVPFGNPCFYNYDPLCFDTVRERGSGRECPIVRVDHEEVLCFDRIEVVKQVGPSFERFVEEFVRAHE